MSETIKLVICLPTAGKVDVLCVASLMGACGRLMGGIQTRPDAAFEFNFDFVASSVWISNREQLAKRAVERGNTHLMFVDDDMSFDPRVLEILLGRRQSVVATNYLIKKQADEDPTFVAVAPNGRRIITRTESTGLQDIAYSGFGVSLFEIDVFKKTPQPWFMPEFVPDESMYTTEDNPFFRKVREAGFPCYIDHDASKLVKHHGVGVWSWEQWRPAKAEGVKLAETKAG